MKDKSTLAQQSGQKESMCGERWHLLPTFKGYRAYSNENKLRRIKMHEQFKRVQAMLSEHPCPILPFFCRWWSLPCMNIHECKAVPSLSHQATEVMGCHQILSSPGCSVETFLQLWGETEPCIQNLGISEEGLFSGIMGPLVPLRGQERENWLESW